MFKHCDLANSAIRSGDNKYASIRSEFGRVCVHSQFDKNTNRDAVSVDHIIAAYEKSIYCLCPPGDTPIRRALFDAFLAGCIPVLFRNRQTPFPIDQYNWHLSTKEIAESFVFLDASNKTLALSNFIDELVVGYSPADVKRRQKAISSVARKMQYSMPPDVRNTGFPNITEILPTWDPPFSDAVDVLLEKMFSKVERYGK